MSDEDVARLLDLEAIKQLKARYFRWIDTKDWDALRTVFTDDLRFDSGNQVFESAEAFVSWVAEHLPAEVTTAHQGFTPEITFTGPDSADGIWAMHDYVAFPSDGLPVGFVGYGHYHEQYLRTPDGWRIRGAALTRIRVDALPGGIAPGWSSVTAGSTEM
jgi:hypothetical protein